MTVILYVNIARSRGPSARLKRGQEFKLISTWRHFFAVKVACFLHFWVGRGYKKRNLFLYSMSTTQSTSYTSAQDQLHR